MKKLVLILGIAVIAISALTACSDKKQAETAKEEAVKIDVTALADELKNGVTFQDEMTELEDSMFEMVYVIDPADVADKKVYISTGATAEEIAVMEGKDAESAKRIKEGLEQRIEDEKANFETYVPEEMKKLESPVLVEKGNYVILCISNENEKALEIINQ